MSAEQLREEATQLLDSDPDKFCMRSCWNCNSAHEHLKNVGYVIMCIWCGHYYYKGVDITTGVKDDVYEQ